ncbi:MAG: glutathione S-transferase [Pseudomonadota bacterium]
MITVHHLEDSRSQRVLWLLEELGVEYDVKRYERDKQTRLAPAALKKVHGLGKSPVVEHDGVVVAETGAIVEYLIDRFGDGGFRPTADERDALQYTYWMHFAEGSMMPQLLLKLFFSQIKAAKMPFFAKPIANGIADRVLRTYVDPNLAEQVAFVDAHLKANDWFAGPEISGADIMMSFPLEAAKSRGAINDSPAITAYIDRFQARPAFRRALERGGDYAYA